MKAKSTSRNRWWQFFIFVGLVTMFFGWIISGIVSYTFREISFYSSLQTRGIETSGCIIDKTINLDRSKYRYQFTYQFVAHGAIFTGFTGTTQSGYDEFPVGACFSIIYLPDNPLISASQAEVVLFDVMDLIGLYGFFISLLIFIAVVAFVISFLITLRLPRRVKKNVL